MFTEFLQNPFIATKTIQTATVLSVIVSGYIGFRKARLGGAILYALSGLSLYQVIFDAITGTLNHLWSPFGFSSPWMIIFVALPFVVYGVPRSLPLWKSLWICAGFWGLGLWLLVGFPHDVAVAPLYVWTPLSWATLPAYAWNSAMELVLMILPAVLGVTVKKPAN